VLAALGAALVMGGFFFDWFSGTAEFAARDFSGADLARLMRNFEIVASSSTESGQLRASAIVLYLGPALALNGAVLAWLPVRGRFAAAAAFVGGSYAGSLLLGLVLLSAVSWTELERVLGGTLAGFWATAAGAVLLLQAGSMSWRSAGAELPPASG
jgi:hypothetical protein